MLIQPSDTHLSETCEQNVDGAEALHSPTIARLVHGAAAVASEGAARQWC